MTSGRIALMAPALFGFVGLFGLTACVEKQTYAAPDEVLVLPAPVGVRVLRTEDVVLKAYLVSSVAKAELGTARCKLGFGYPDTEVSLPARIAIPVLDGLSQNIAAECSAKAGPATLEKGLVLRPSNEPPEGRTYDEVLTVQFTR